MSLGEVIFSRPEVVLSLVFVGLVLLAAVGLAVGPGIYRRQKKKAALRKAEREAKLAEAKKRKSKGKAAKGATKPKRARTPEPDDDDGEDAVAPATAEPVVAVAAAPAVETSPATQATTPAAAPQAAAPAPVTPETPAPAEEKPAEDDSVSDLNDLLGVFVDEEADARYEVLMRNVEVSDADALLAMAKRVAGELGSDRRS